MAKVKVVGNAVVITSTLKVEELKNLERYRPAAMNLMGGEDGKDLIFSIMLTDNPSGVIGKNGAAFPMKTRNEDGFAEITMDATWCGENVKESVVDQLGGALMNLHAMEEALPAVVKAIEEDKKAVADMIE